MQTKPLGRLIRRFGPSARLLTEYRSRTLVRAPEFADLLLCTRFARPGSTAVDVGASVGNYAVAMMRAVGKHGRVLALEANPTVFEELRHSIWGTAVEAHNVAASNAAGPGVLLIPTDTRGRALEPIASLVDRGQRARRVTVSQVRLDDLLRDVDDVSLLKVDVEGHELQVLKGASNVLERHRPTVVAEIEDRHMHGGTVGDVVDYMAAAGYVCHAIHGSRLIDWRDFDLDRWQRRWLADGQPSDQSVNYVNNFVFRCLDAG